MHQAFIILFRETLEIAIILGIIATATRGITGRGRWIGIGIAGGVLGSAVVALFADAIAEAAEGMGQDLFNGGVLMAAVLMIGWTVVWMQKHGREISQRIKHVSRAVGEGELPMAALASVISLTMWREGSEIVLFMTGILATSGESLAAIASGALAGAAAAGALGYLLYLGLLKIPARHLFTATAWLLILLACGMSAQAANYFTAAGLLPEWIPQMWDSSAILAEDSAAGRIMHAMIGYSDRPSGTQAAFYGATLLSILALLKWQKMSVARGAASAA